MALSFGLSLISEAITAGGASLNLPLAGATALDSRVTFTRGSNATMVGSNGLLQYAPNNLLTYSQEFDNAAWGKTEATVTANAAVAPDGTTTADKLIATTVNSTHSVTQFSATAGQLYAFSVYAKAGEYSQLQLSGFGVEGQGFNTVYNLANQTVTFAPAGSSITAVGNGWYRCTLVVTATNTAGPIIRIRDNSENNAFSGDGTSGIYLWGAQLNVGALQPYYPTTSAAYYGPRLVYDPATLAAQGLLVEEQRTNTIRNNTMVGAVAGTPGTLPTNWSYYTALTGLTRQVVGTGIEDGVSYVDIRISGTPSASGSVNYYTETSTAVAAAVGQTWAESSYFKLQAGSLAGITATRLYLQENNSGGGYLVEQNFTVSAPTTAALALQRSTATRTLTNASTAFVMPGFNLLLSGAAVDITLRIGMPQLELGAFATSVIPTTTAQATRAADVATMTGTNFSSWYNQTEGTLVADATVPYTVPSAVFPMSAAFTDGTTNNFMQVGYLTSGVSSLEVTTAGVSQVGIFPVVGTANRRTAAAYKLNDFAVSTNGGAVATDTSGTVPVVDRLRLGDRVSGNTLNGTIKSITYYPRRLANTELQALTS